MTQIAKQDSRGDQSHPIQGPHTDSGLEAGALESIQFKYEFAMTCVAEARKFPSGSPDHKENLHYAKEFLDAALEATPNNPQFHFSKGLVSAELGDTTSAMNSFRNAVIYNPSGAAEYMTVLQIGSQEINRLSPGTISATTLKIQSLIASGNYEAAFSAAHTDINGSILRNAEPNLWNVQLLRVAAMQIGAERAYVDILNNLEQRGFLNAQDTEYLPVGYTFTEEMRQEMRAEVIDPGGVHASSKIWSDLRIHDITPIDGTAVKVGPKANQNH
jgi:hypothetical protein